MNMLVTKVVRVTDVRLRYTGAWLLLAIGVSFSAVAHAGPGVWTSGGPYSGGNEDETGRACRSPLLYSLSVFAQPTDAIQNWTGSRMIVWGGSDGSVSLNDGGQWPPVSLYRKN
jgi:hypothetical protein